MKILIVAERNGRQAPSGERRDRREGDGVRRLRDRRGRPAPIAITRSRTRRGRGAREVERRRLVLTGATLNGRDLGARVAAKLGWAYAADCTDACGEGRRVRGEATHVRGKGPRDAARADAGGALDPPGAWTLAERRG